MKDEIKEILEDIKCPQLGYDEYGKWGALPLNVRTTLKRLCDYVVSCDDYITNLQQENERLKEWKEDLLKENIELENIRKEAIDKLTIKQARFINEKNYILDDNDLDEIMYILQNGSDDNG